MRAHLQVAVATVAIGVCAGNLYGQQTSLPGYTAAEAQRERALEASTVARPDSAQARADSRMLSSDVHVAGTPAQARTRDFVIDAMKRWGL